MASEPTQRDQRPPTQRDQRPPTQRDQRPPTQRDQRPHTQRDHAPPRSALRLPDYLEAEYDLIEDLDSGGEANVAVIRRRRDGVCKVVKIYHRGITLSQSFVDRLATADPAHVLPVTRSTYTGWGAPRFIEVMDFLPDGSLETLLARSGGRAPELALDILVEMTEALQYIHQRMGIVHRDIKPANILIRSRQPLDLVLADLGIAAELAATRQSRRDTTGGIKGTLVYQSPETLNTPNAGRSRDWWAVGMMMCEVLTGQHPFKDGSGRPLRDENAIRHAITMGDIDLSAVADPRWNLLCRGLLVHNPVDRWSAPQIRAWLDGDSPPVAAARPAGIRGDRPIPAFRFARRRFTDPVQLATHMVTNWDAAVSLFTSKQQCDALRAWIREDVRDTHIETNLLTPVGGRRSQIDARILEFAAHYRGSDVIYRGAPINSRDLAIRYLQAGDDWPRDPLLQSLEPDVVAALVETQFDEKAGPAGQSAEYYALARLSRYAKDVDQRIDAAAAAIVQAATTRVAGVDVGVDVREAIPRRITRAKGVARAALLSPACLTDLHRDLTQMDRSGPHWFAALCAQTRPPARHPDNADADAQQIATTALAHGVGDLARHYQQAVAAAEAAEQERRREIEAAEAAAVRHRNQAIKRGLTLRALGAAAVAVAALIAHIMVTPKVPPTTEWPFSWVHEILNFPSATFQQVALVLAIAALVLMVVVVNFADLDLRMMDTATKSAIGFGGVCLLPLVLSAVCFVLLIALGIAAVGVVILIAIGIAGAAS
ncbi:Serine/threonine protein kinase [Mycolicibacterium rutilum]|uniref:Serine/threonine protein kinase n=1 Tax=Mycolicibacterium rutilum TaxID=370526 RepID=A0A1H6IDI5_MYCRU|nr:protein kinase [Mycolicibacterium rutilum]SEH46779.1 Serine/threonine protein kinase [Mycolicibacterium rutilum]